MFDDGRPLGQSYGDPDDQRGPIGSKYAFGVAPLLRHRKLIGLCVIALFMLGLLFVLVRPVTYTASTQLLIYNRQLQPGPDAVVLPVRVDIPLVENAIEIFKSRSVLTKVIETLQLNQDPEFVSNSLSFWEVVKGWIQGFPSAMSDDRSVATERALEFFWRRLTVARVGVSYTVNVSFTSSDPNKAARLSNEVARSGSQVLSQSDPASPRTALRERLRRLGLNAYVISAADPPIRPDGLGRVLIIMAATLVGLGAGVAVALLLELRDHTIRTAEQALQQLGIECLGVVPRLHQVHNLSSLAQGPCSTLCRLLRRAGLVVQSMHGVRSVGVTSARPGEGATSVAATLAHLSARSGRKVLLVHGGSGTRSPSRAEVSNVSSSKELFGGAKLLETGVANERGGLNLLSIFDSTVIDTKTAWETCIDEVLHDATNSYDLVIVDLPSLSSGPDVQIVGQKLDAMLLVVKWGGTDVELVQRWLCLTGRTRSKFVGVILNMADRVLIRRYGDKLAAAEASLAAERLA